MASQNYRYLQTYEKVIKKMEPTDAKRIKNMVMDLATNRQMRNFGANSAKELIVAISIFLVEKEYRG